MHCTISLEASAAVFLSPNSLLEKIEQETWRETGISFVTSVTRLMERLLDYRYLAPAITCSKHKRFVKIWYLIPTGNIFVYMQANRSLLGSEQTPQILISRALIVILVCLFLRALY